MRGVLDMTSACETSITVESCLAELREMVPDKVIFIQDNVEWWADDVEPCRATVISIDYPPSKQAKFTGDNLADAMAQVRAWKESQ